MSGYVDHGRRHLPGGTDPIPGLSLGGAGASIEYAYAYCSGMTASTTTTLLAWDSGVIIGGSGGYFIDSSGEIMVNRPGCYLAMSVANIVGGDPWGPPAAESFRMVTQLDPVDLTPPAGEIDPRADFWTIIGGSTDQGHYVYPFVLTDGDTLASPRRVRVYVYKATGASRDFIGSLFVYRLGDVPA